MFSVRRLLRLLGLGCVLLGGAEISARVDDWVRHEVPLSANPNRERDLVLGESWGFRGRPHGRYRKWQLDGDGFRVIADGANAAPDEPRLLVLGASETFGLYESPGKEYPAQLASKLRAKEPVRVVNAAMAGITLKSLIVYWDHWAGHFDADQVAIYPSPQFYLDNEPPALPTTTRNEEERASFFIWRPRLLGRFQDVYHRLPSWMKKYREEWVIRRETAGKGSDWFFTRVPDDRLHQFEGDLRQLLVHVRQRHAQPILLTHARAVVSNSGPEDEAYLRGMRMFFPRATPETLLAFDQQANEAIRRLAVEEHVTLIDVDRALSGRRELFADLFHFNDDGATKMAEVLAEQLPPLHVSQANSQ